MDKCIFCRIIRGEIPTHIIDENEQVIVLLSLENHPLVVTKKHVETIYTLEDDAAAAVMQMAVKIARATKIALQCEGINLVQSNEPGAHQDVFHFHLHIKPRWQGDGVILKWNLTPVDENVKQETAEKIRQQLRVGQ